MPALTTALTTAFMPALSPPDVRTASFILDVEVLAMAVNTMPAVNSEMVVDGEQDALLDIPLILFGRDRQSQPPQDLL